MKRRVSSLSAVCLLLIVGNAASAATPKTIRVSVSSSGKEGEDISANPSISANGRWVAFDSVASQLVPEDTNGERDVFVHDMRTGTTELVSVNSHGEQANSSSFLPSISPNGREVAFTSNATNLGDRSDLNREADVFVHNLRTGLTTLVSKSTDGQQQNDYGVAESISNNHVVSFSSLASNLVSDSLDPYAMAVYVHDMRAGTTRLASRSSSGEPGMGWSSDSSLSANGRLIAFFSNANNLIPNDVNPEGDVFVRDLRSGVTSLVSVSSEGEQGNANSLSPPWIDMRGRRVAFASDATNLVAGDSNGVKDIFVHDLQTGKTVRVSVDSSGGQANEYSDAPSISRQGLVAFISVADNLIPNDSNGEVYDVFVHNLHTGSTRVVSVNSSGRQSNESSIGYISGNGRYVAFQSAGGDLVTDDTNQEYDVFVFGPLPQI